jgi:glutamyl-tRNA synthetase
VIRGDDHLSNTPKQILLYEALGHAVPTFGHVPMILGSDGKRLSKRHGATAVGEYEGQGLLPEAMVNFLALLGWSPGDDQEVMTVEVLVQRFSMERVLKKSSVFDLKKLDWLSGQHFSVSAAEELEPALTAGLEAAGLAAPGELKERGDWYLSLIDLLKSRARRIPDLVDLARPFLVEEVDFDPEAIAKHWLKAPAEVLENLTALRSALEAATWEPESLEAVIRGYAAEISVGAGRVIHPLRVAITGSDASPGIFEVLAFLGKIRVLARIDEAIVRLRSL